MEKTYGRRLQQSCAARRGQTHPELDLIRYCWGFRSRSLLAGGWIECSEAPATVDDRYGSDVFWPVRVESGPRCMFSNAKLMDRIYPPWMKPAGQCVLWWELRRAPYNLVLAITGLITITVLEVAATKLLTPGEDGIEPMALFILVPLYAIAANIAYTLQDFLSGPNHICGHNPCPRVSVASPLGHPTSSLRPGSSLKSVVKYPVHSIRHGPSSEPCHSIMLSHSRGAVQQCHRNPRNPSVGYMCGTTSAMDR